MATNREIAAQMAKAGNELDILICHTTSLSITLVGGFHNVSIIHK